MTSFEEKRTRISCLLVLDHEVLHGMFFEPNQLWFR